MRLALIAAATVAASTPRLISGMLATSRVSAESLQDEAPLEQETGSVLSEGEVEASLPLRIERMKVRQRSRQSRKHSSEPMAIHSVPRTAPGMH